MGRIPPVQCEWGHGWNGELIHMLNKFIEENPEHSDDVADAKRIIDNIERYGRSNDDGESFYMFEREAADLIYLLLALNTCQEITLRVRTEYFDKFQSDVFDEFEDVVTKYQEIIDKYQKDIAKYQETIDILFWKIEKDAPQLLEETNENSPETDIQ